jgi:hypothetical protein
MTVFHGTSPIDPLDDRHRRRDRDAEGSGWHDALLMELLAGEEQ